MAVVEDEWRRRSELCRLPDGGYAGFPGETAQVDVTAWSALANQWSLLAGAPADPAPLTWLSERQAEDGLLSYSELQPIATWPTAIAMLAWFGNEAFYDRMVAATRFLELIWAENVARIPLRAGPAGWPWTVGTAGWVEPTALAMLALRAFSVEPRPRVLEARDFLMERQLPSGGWNYGNTIVFDVELRPMTESTAQALTALAGLVDRSDVAASLDYLQEALEKVSTPLTVAWGLLALSAWDLRPAEDEGMLAACLAREFSGYPYRLDLLALLTIAERSTQGLLTPTPSTS